MWRSAAALPSAPFMCHTDSDAGNKALFASRPDSSGPLLLEDLLLGGAHEEPAGEESALEWSQSQK